MDEHSRNDKPTPSEAEDFRSLPNPPDGSAAIPDEILPTPQEPDTISDPSAPTLEKAEDLLPDSPSAEASSFFAAPTDIASPSAQDAAADIPTAFRDIIDEAAADLSDTILSLNGLLSDDPESPQSTAVFDPLSDAQELPNLFPQEEAPPAQEEVVQPTVVPRPEKKKKHRGRRIVLRCLISLFKWLVALILALAVLVGGLVGYLTVTEYDPDYAEKADVGNRLVTTTLSGASLRIVTFNTGYGALGKDADFFMDGGDGVTPESEELIKSNMVGIETILKQCDADILLLQEVDTDSKRSYELNQWLQYEYDLNGYESRFALNYSCDFVPYPLNDFIGKVHSGLATFSRYDISSATRYALPCPFDWPVRVANLKRCLLVTRIPIEGREQELVIINLHLEAYDDDGEGRIAQTKQLLSLLEEEYAKGNYVIAGGDFNQIFPDCDAYPLLDEAYWTPGKLDTLPDGWRYVYDDSQPTCRLLNKAYDPQSDATQYYVLDGFIVSPNVTVTSVRTRNEGFVYSDHNPVVIDIELN